METLLEKAKKARHAQLTIKEQDITDEHLELVMGYLDGLISIRQAAEALDMKHPGNFTNFISRIITVLYKTKRIKIIKVD